MESRITKPPWLRLRLPRGPQFEQTRQMLKEQALHTVCQEACCPNVYDCFSRHTATFLILGDRCTRNCTFCAVAHGPANNIDSEEPRRIATAVSRMALKYVVVTSVTRDDLPDGGAGMFAKTISAIKAADPTTRIEVLIPDFQGDPHSLHTVLSAGPHVCNHNVETVPRLYDRVRPDADYRQSLELLRRAADFSPQLPTKSGIMLGLGETETEIHQVLIDLRKARCRILTMGQYLQPSRNHHPVKRYAAPAEFDHWHKIALEMGFSAAICTPLTRSSYQAQETYSRLAADREAPRRSENE